MSDAIDLDQIRSNGPLLRAIIQRNVPLQKQAGNTVGLCPFHDEKTPSFTVFDDGHFHCFGCGAHGTIVDWFMLRENLDFPAAKQRVLTEAGYNHPDVQKSNSHGPRSNGADMDIAREYNYRNAAGAVVVQSVRTKSGKPRFKQRHPDGNGGWIWAGIDNPPPYRLPELLAAKKGSTVYLCEGEKDADRLHQHGLLATTNIGGSSNWKPQYADVLAGQHVVILEDNDQAGRDRSVSVKRTLERTAETITILPLPGLKPKGDVSDWLEAGNNIKELERLARKDRQEPAIFPVEMFRDIEINKDAQDFVEGLLVAGSMVVIYGNANCGKTFFATDLGLHVACGWPWNGRDVMQGAVIYLALEGSHGIRNRVAAFREHHGLSEKDIPFAVIPVAMNLLDPAADTDKLIATISHVAKELQPVPVRLTVVDTLSRALAGGNENAPDDMGAIVTNGTKIQQTTKSALAWVHHTGKDETKGARGHTLLRAATDTEIEIAAEGPHRMARVTKQREMECAGEFTFSLKVVELGINHRGKPITSCVVDHGAGPIVGEARRHTTGHTKRALEILIDLCAEAGQTGHTGAPPGVSSVPEKWWRDRFYDRAAPGDSEDAKQKAFRRASVALLNDRLVGMANRRVWYVSFPSQVDRT